MKNLLAELDLPPRADPADVRGAIDAADDASGDAVAVLGDALRREHYERVHLQYRAIAAAMPVLELAGTTDSHRWTERVVEFLPADGIDGVDRVDDVETGTTPDANPR